MSFFQGLYPPKACGFWVEKDWKFSLDRFLKNDSFFCEIFVSGILIMVTFFMLRNMDLSTLGKKYLMLAITWEIFESDYWTFPSKDVYISVVLKINSWYLNKLLLVKKINLKLIYPAAKLFLLISNFIFFGYNYKFFMCQRKTSFKKILHKKKFSSQFDCLVPVPIHFVMTHRRLITIHH